MVIINPFLANVTVLYPLKTSESQRIIGIFREFKTVGKISSKLNLKYQKKVARKFSLLFLIFSYWYVCNNWITLGFISAVGIKVIWRTRWKEKEYWKMQKHS